MPRKHSDHDPESWAPLTWLVRLEINVNPIQSEVLDKGGRRSSIEEFQLTVLSGVDAPPTEIMTLVPLLRSACTRAPNSPADVPSKLRPVPSKLIDSGVYVLSGLKKAR